MGWTADHSNLPPEEMTAHSGRVEGLDRKRRYHLDAVYHARVYTVMRMVPMTTVPEADVFEFAMDVVDALDDFDRRTAK